MAHPSRPISDVARFVLVALALSAATARAQDDKAGKRQAQGLVTQGVKLLAHKDYDRALEKFRAAYDAFPSPKILLDIGSTLRDMGRIAEAANTYQRYLDDAGAEAARTVEVKKLLRDLDKRLDVLVIDVTPGGAEVAIDDGPWVPVGGRMQTRVEAGMHLVRARKHGVASREQQVDGHPGGHDEVTIDLEAAPPSPPPAVSVAPPAPTPAPIPPPPPAEPRANRTPERRVAVEEPIVAPPPPVVADEPVLVVVRERGFHQSPIALSVQSRFDGRLRGAAGAIGLVIDAAPALELEISALIAHDAKEVVPGGYAGLRLRAGERVRPFLGGGVPVIVSGAEARVAVRGSAGVELAATEHLTLLADFGVEHFFNPQPTYAATLFVPILGIQGHY